MAPWFEVFAVGQRNCREQAISLRTGLLVKSRVGVEKGTKAVISANSSVYGGLEFNNLRSNFVADIPGKEFFNSHRRYHSLTFSPRSALRPMSKKICTRLRLPDAHRGVSSVVIVICFHLR